MDVSVQVHAVIVLEETELAITFMGHVFWGALIRSLAIYASLLQVSLFPAIRIIISIQL